MEESGLIEVPLQSGFGCYRVSTDDRSQAGLDSALSRDERYAFDRLLLAWVVPSPESTTKELEISTGPCQLLLPGFLCCAGPGAGVHKHPT